MDNNFKDLKNQSKKLPSLPGVYLFKNIDNQILYIGKAKNLKNRITSYFQNNDNLKNLALLENSSKIEHIATKSELEAMLLEAELIKANQPKFNILLKDGQPFLYIMIPSNTKKLPELKIVRNKKTKGTYFGPFLEKTSTRKVYNFLLKTFKLKLCSQKIENGCLDYHMGLCAGNCKPNFNEKNYLQRLELAKLSLQKGHSKFLKYLEAEILKNNTKLNFEKSKELYEYLKAFKIIFNNLDENYSFKNPNNSLITKDIWILSEDKKSLFLFKEKNTSLSKKQLFVFPFIKKENKTSKINSLPIHSTSQKIYSFNANEYNILEKSKANSSINYIEYITSYYQNFNCANTILTNFDIKKDEKDLLEKFLKKFHKKDQPVNIIKPKDGHLYNLIKLAKINVDQYLEKQKDLATSLQNLFKLDKEIHTIDCFDISHKQGTFMVGSCVRFKDGQPDKKNFRHFKIKTVHQSDDYASLQEIVKRRYKNPQNIPDLVLIDGGKGQLNSVIKVLPNANIASLAKREETIFSQNIPLGKILNIQNYTSQVLIALRDYTHHFAISYHKKLSKFN
jgi:excinuclease ABC subunit C